MDMEFAEKIIEELTAETLAKSNCSYPAFRNLHEAYAVIKEELEEADEEREFTQGFFNELWYAVRQDDIQKATQTAQHISTYLTLQICELLQAKAMAEKLIQSKESIEEFYRVAKGEEK